MTTPLYNALSPLLGLMGKRRKAYLRIQPSGGDYPTGPDTDVAGSATGAASGVASAYAEAQFVVGPDGAADSLGSATSAALGVPFAYIGRQFSVLQATAGNVTVQLRDGSTYTFAAGVGTTLLPLAVFQVTANTGAGTYTNLR